MGYINEQYYILSLAKAIVLQDEIPIDKSVNWKVIYNLCKYHKIDNLIAYGIDYLKQEIDIPKQIIEAFDCARKQGIMRQTIQDHELKKIEEKFEQLKVSNVALKGSFLKQYYPSKDMRLLTDLDILFKSEEKEKMHQGLKELGYYLKYPGSHHDVYVKQPLTVVEMHYSCYSNSYLNQHFNNLFSRVVNKSSKKYCFEMSLEDYYLFMIGHMAKHFVYGGIGVRSIIDLIVFNVNFKDECDWKFVDEQLNYAGLLCFRNLLQKLIDGYRDDELLNCIFKSGAFGTSVNSLNLAIVKDGESEIKILKNRLYLMLSMSYHLAFPKIDFMKEKYPYLRKYTFLLPFAYFQRGFSKLVNNRQEFFNIIKKPFIPKKKGIKEIAKIYKRAGLKRENFHG